MTSVIGRGKSKEVFRTCNVLPFSCTHLPLCTKARKRPKVHGKQKGFKNDKVKDPRYMENKKDSRTSLGKSQKLIKIAVG